MRLALAILLLATMGSAALGQSRSDAQSAAVYERLIRRVGRAELGIRIADLSQWPTRLAGSAGERGTLEYVEREFRRLGLRNVRRETFAVTVPDPEAKGSLSLEGGRVEVLPLWPNLVRTSTCDVKGPLVYARSGSLDDLNGKELEGAIVVLEFQSGSNWKTVFRFGAKAVIFLEPEEMERAEAEQKFSSAPLNAPRFLASKSDRHRLISASERHQTASLQCRQDWVRRTTFNVLADLPDGDGHVRDERIVIAAPADGMSIVPGRAPGASAAASVAAMLELARLAVLEPGRRPMTFMAVTANGLGLQGWREYAERRVQEGKPTFLHVTLDLNDGSETLGAFGRAWYYEYRNETLDPIRNVTRSMREHANRIAPILGVPGGRNILLDSANESDGRTWRNAIYGKFAMGCEPLNLAGIASVTLSTVENDRRRLDTVSDDLPHLNLERIRRQTQVLACLAWRLTRDTSDPGELSAFKVAAKVDVPRRHSLVGGFGTLEGQVVRFDPNRSFVPDIPVPQALAVVQHSQKTLAGVRGHLVQFTEGERAQYRFFGLAPKSAFFHLDARDTRIGAYRPDPPTGDIVVASTDVLFGYDTGRIFELVTTYRSASIVVFDAVPTDLYGLVDPQELRPLTEFRLMDPTADAQPKNYSMALASPDQKLNSDPEDVGVLFLEAGTRFKLLMGTSIGEWRLMLTGATPRSPFGEGYAVEARPSTFQDISLRTVEDILELNSSRLRKFDRYHILNPDLRKMQEEALQDLALAKVAKSGFRWGEYDRHSRAAWGRALRAHPLIQKTVNDVVAGVLFYLVLIVPFSYFFERLLFAKRSLTSQLLHSIGIFVASFLALRAIHPAFEIVTNPAMIFVAFVMGAMSLLVTTFIVGKFEASLKELRAARTGLGHVDIGRMSVAMAAFNLGIANMRRRRARTTLTTLTLVVMTFIVLSFTSIVPEVQVAEFPSGRRAAYEGILVRMPGLEPLPSVAYRSLASEFAGRGMVVRRAWYYGADIGDQGSLSVSHGDQAADVRAIAGFDGAEESVSGIPKSLLPGGRWFRPADRKVAILTRQLAAKLAVRQGDALRFAGMDYQVIGLLDDGKAASSLDLDGEAVLPADFSMSKRFQARSSSATQAFRKFLRIDPATCLFLPIQDVLALGGEVRSIAVKLNDSKEVRPALASLMPRLRMNLYAGVPAPAGAEVRQFSVLQGSRGAGMGLILVQMAIASVFVLNTMVASVYERKREIGIFSSIGLAPNHIGVLFFAESCVYGVLGAVIGYFMAQGVAKLVVEANLAPGLYLNFSAASAVLSAAIVLGVVLLSTIYPSKIAERLAAPAFDESGIGEPDGDRWTILLPFRVQSEEAVPLLEFFADWLQGHEEYAVGKFVTRGARLVLEAGELPRLESSVWLAPFDLGVSQNLGIRVRPSGASGVVELELELLRTGGEPKNWQTLNRPFYVSVRSHFLAWRTRPRASLSASGTGNPLDP